MSRTLPKSRAFCSEAANAPNNYTKEKRAILKSEISLAKYRRDGKSGGSLAKIDPDDVQKWKRDDAIAQTAELGKEIAELQSLLYATNDCALLIVLQGMDTSGKDGSIRGLSQPLNAQGCRVSSFKVPTEEEKAHDFLWRVHPQVPQKGQISIFNRSHYEDVVVVRVHDLVPEEVWRKRYEQIRQFESLLVASGTIVLKFFLHITKSEQKKRLEAREADATKSWKLSVGDWQEREFWNDYQQAYEDAIAETATKEAPWTIVPANEKWFRDLVIAETVADALRPRRDEWLKELTERGKVARKAIDEFRAKKRE